MIKLSLLFLVWGLGISTALVVALLIMGVTSALRYADRRHEADVARYHLAERERDYEKARANDAEARAETCSKYVKERKERSFPRPLLPD